MKRQHDRPKAALVMERSSAGKDFSYFAQQVPGLFYFVGITPPDVDLAKAPGNHSPRFKVNEAGLIRFPAD